MALIFFDLERLLRCALDALGVRVAILVVLIHGSLTTECSGTGVGVGILKVHRLGHSLVRWDVLEGRRREDVAEGVEGCCIGGPALLGEFDGKLDVEVAKVVVAV